MIDDFINFSFYNLDDDLLEFAENKKFDFLITQSFIFILDYLDLN